MNIKKPIFIIGSGRSGTTLLYNLLALHPDLCWFSNLTEKLPRVTWLAAFHRTLDWPWLGSRMKDQFLQRTRLSIRPSEAGNIYHNYCGLDNTRRMTEADLTTEQTRKFRRVVEGHLRFTGKARFLAKQTTNCQHIRLIHAIFPDAYYIHIIRDGRAVANSLHRVKWWPEISVWWLGQQPQAWAAQGKEPIALCALHWQHDVQEILQNKYLFAERYLEIHYEDLIENPSKVIERLLPFCGLRETAEFRQRLPQSFKNMNYKWQTQLSESQKQILEETIGDFLLELGYRV